MQWRNKNHTEAQLRKPCEYETKSCVNTASCSGSVKYMLNIVSHHMVRHPRCLIQTMLVLSTVEHNYMVVDVCYLLHNYQLHVSALMAIFRLNELTKNIGKLFVYKKNQLDVTFCILYFSSDSCSTCFGQPCAHHQELTTA